MTFIVSGSWGTVGGQRNQGAPSPMHQEEETTFVSIIPVSQQRSITRAALLAHDGRHAEAEVVRFAAGYHNLKEDHHPNT